MRTRSPARRTLPSRIVATPSSAAISRRGFWVPLYRITEVREMTFRSRIFASWVRMSSVIPSAKKAFSGSGLRF